MRLADAACGAVTRSYPWFNRSSLPVLTSNWSQEGSARWKQTFIPVHNGTQYSSELPDKEPHFSVSCCRGMLFCRRLMGSARGAVARGYPWSTRSSLPQTKLFPSRARCDFQSFAAPHFIIQSDSCGMCRTLPWGALEMDRFCNDAV